MEQYNPKLGESVVVVWKKEDGSAIGGTEGVVLGVTGDKVSGEYLVLDRSTYQGSFKSFVLSLGILDLRVVPVKDAESIEKADVRQRPPGISENFNMKMEVVYESNIDFNATVTKIKERTDCKVTPIQAPQSNAEYGKTIKEIKAIKGASINILATGTFQIFCPHEKLDDCINWIQEAVELLSDHKRLVLFPMRITYRISDTYKDKSRPTEEVINRIAKSEGGSPIIFPFGWAHRFFVELDKNPLQGLFPSDQPLENFVLEDEKRRKDMDKHPDKPIETESKQTVDLQFPRSGVNVAKYLGTDAPLMRVTGLIKSPKDDEDLMRMWLGSRSDTWQWFEWGQIHGKMIIHDLTIDRKAGVYTVDFRKYSGNEF